MKSYLFDTGSALRPNGDSVFRRMESNYSAHCTGGDSFSIIVIVAFQ
ncbi:hypothetical protein B0F87_103349 [Methylobacter tundripaludum]|uniref:Uncharacterized protein n=1 Tax=Methylobacter tundripaludum TaxID=173365 RepID=A0A2S6HGZ2_9GAMM|nr:hypothetical protein [Methylobacter tundripaludum]PPK76742.1 hypothetical protein B0F87_103349 [Methylobacter tundripaludum]